MITDTVRQVVASLARNRLRTGLTVIGISIGIAAVICTAALGAGGSVRVERQIAALGDDFLWIRAGSVNAGGVRTGAGGVHTLTPEDAGALLAIQDIAACSPLLSGREQLVAPGQNWNSRYQGVLPDFLDIRRRTVAAGTWFGSADVAAAARVIVLGTEVAARLFGDENPIGRIVRIGRFPFQVIGVLAPLGADHAGVDRDDVVFLPLSTALRSLDRRTYVNDIMCGVRDPVHMDRAEAAAGAMLRDRHHLSGDDPDDFEIQKPIEYIEMRAQTTRTMSLLLIGIGAVSLVVGGIGIMNIMLVAVTERRREIGVRLAVGARVRDVRTQFLGEAVCLGLVGAACGVAIGRITAWAVTRGLGWPTVVSADAVMSAVVAAVAASIVFGYYPAFRASMLDPIEAIRGED
jgi:putative ABC transport system permease protein